MPSFSLQTGEERTVGRMLQQLPAFTFDSPFPWNAWGACLDALREGNGNVAISSASTIVQIGAGFPPGQCTLVGSGHIRFSEKASRGASFGILTNRGGWIVYGTDFSPFVAKNILQVTHDELGPCTNIRFCMERNGDEPMPQMSVRAALDLLAPE
jgi:hypothetical protein